MKHFKLFSAFCLFLLLAEATVFCQEPTPQPTPTPENRCPWISVTCPDKTGTTMKFVATVVGGDSNVKPTYTWTVSTGVITQGQGTPEILVDTTGDHTLTATVKVVGFDKDCLQTASCSTQVNLKIAPTIAGTYGTSAVEHDYNRLDAYARELNRQPQAQAYILAYGGRRGRAGEAQDAADSARNYLVKSREIEPNRIVTIDSGYREKFILELWIVPPGATPPAAAPTVNPNEVETTKPKAQPKRTGRTKRNRT